MNKALIVRFRCPVCEQAAIVRAENAVQWQCRACDHALRIEPHAGDHGIESCSICDNRECYKKKNFPHWLGLGILIVASLTFLVAQAVYWQWLGWSIFIGSAVLDGLLYLYVGDVIVCYRCGAQFMGVNRGSGHAPHELGISERYRQERIRREQVKSIL